MKTAVIVPYFNRWDLTHKRLWELYQHVPPQDLEIILINDFSTDLDCESGVVWWQKEVQRHPVRYKRNKANLGFGASMNVGAKIAVHYDAELLIFLSNDVEVSGNFVSQIQSKVQENENSLIGGEVIYFPGGWNEFTVDGKDIVVPYVNGWLMACTSDVWKTLGGFDLRYGKYDYEDLDLSTSALAHGYAIIGLNSNFVSHKQQGSTISTTSAGKDRLEHTKQNRIKYEDKWLNRLGEIVETNNDVSRGS